MGGLKEFTNLKYLRIDFFLEDKFEDILLQIIYPHLKCLETLIFSEWEFMKFTEPIVEAFTIGF